MIRTPSFEGFCIGCGARVHAERQDIYHGADCPINSAAQKSLALLGKGVGRITFASEITSAENARWLMTLATTDAMNRLAAAMETLTGKLNARK